MPISKEIQQEQKQEILDIIEKKYSIYPELKEIKEQLKRLYLKEYDFLISQEKVLNIKEEDMVEQVFQNMKDIFQKIMPEMDFN